MYNKGNGDCQTLTPRPSYTGSSGSIPCEYSYNPPKTDSKNKYLHDNWVVTIIFCCFIIAGQIGLGIFGFLIFRGKNGDEQLIPNNDKENDNHKTTIKNKNNNMLLNLKKN